MLNPSHIVLGALASFVATSAFPQTDSSGIFASPDAYVREVLRKNPGLVSARTRIGSAEARVPQASAWDDPLAAVEFYATPVTSANPFRDGMETDYSLQQMIPIFGQRSLMGDVARANARMVRHQAAAVERTLVAQARGAYAMLYAAQRRANVNGESHRLLEQIIESARAKYSVGRAAQADVLRLEVELARLRNERSDLDREITAGAAMMNALRAEPTGTPVGSLPDLQPRRPEGTLDALVERALAERPELLAMREEIAMNAAEAAAAGRMRLPELMVRGMYKDMKEGTDQWAAMVGLTIPLAPWGIGKYAGKIEESELNVRSGEQALADMQNMVRAEVTEAFARVEARWQQIERYHESILPRSEQSLESTLAGYQTDRADFLSLLDTYRILQMFRMEYFMVVGEYVRSVAALERAVGGNLEVAP